MSDVSFAMIQKGSMLFSSLHVLEVLDINFGTSPVIVPNSTPNIEKAKSNSNGKSESIIIYPNDKTYYFIAKQ